MKVAVRAVLITTSNERSGSVTLNGSPIRHRPFWGDRSAIGQRKPQMAIDPKPPAIDNIPMSQIQSCVLPTYGARIACALSTRNVYLGGVSTEE
jgi:hypothetical protein